MKGKTTRRQTQQVKTSFTEIMDIHKYITLSANLMFVNKIPFFNTISDNVKFGITDYVLNNKGNTLYTSLLQVINIYKMQGFQTTHIKTNRQFELMMAKLTTIGI